MTAPQAKIGVFGEGPFIGYFITEGISLVGDAAWYDLSKKTQEALEAERALIASQSARPADFKAKGKLASGRASKKDVDVAVIFSDNVIQITSRSGKARFKLPQIDTLSALSLALKPVLKKVSALAATA